MITNITDAAAFVLPMVALVTAFAVAYVASVTRRQMALVPATRPHTADSFVWFEGTAKRTTGGTSADPQSRGSTG